MKRVVRRTASCWKGAATMLGGLFALLSAMLAPPTASAQAFVVLHSFNGADGAYPLSALIEDSVGNLYGTTEEGAYGFGTVFELSPTGTETVLHAFTGVDGAYPCAGVVRDSAGNLYGTTGSNTSSGSGTIFELQPDGNLILLFGFYSGADGYDPTAGLTQDSQGNLYGATQQGGNDSCIYYGCGVVFKLNAKRNYRVLYAFPALADGASPYASVALDSSGDVYGSSINGGDTACPLNGNGCGTLFEVSPAGQERVLYAFQGGTDGAFPEGSVLRDKAGNIYGTTAEGGDLSCYPPYGCGTVFSLSRSGKQTVLHAFTGGSDGEIPYAGLIRDAEGNLYGTTFAGGNGSQCGNPAGCGIVFKIDMAGNETLLHAFSGGTDGAFPNGALLWGSLGALYGTASGGGLFGFGTVFKVKP